MCAQGSGKLETLSPIVSPTVFSTSHPPRTLEPCLSLCLPLCHLILKLVSQLVFHLSPSLMSPTLFPSLSPTMSPTVSPALFPTLFPALPPSLSPHCVSHFVSRCVFHLASHLSPRPPYMVSKSSPSCFTDVVSHLSPNCLRLAPHNAQLSLRGGLPIIPNWFPLVSMSDLPIVSQLCPLALALHLKSSLLLGCKAGLIVMYGVAVWYRILLRHNLITLHTHNAACEVVQSDGWTWDGCTRINECINQCLWRHT